MILDEAHSIKNVNSIRWNTLLEFSCRNRLLLTGTPIQNSMSELWALLHFIMPKLFDSHEQFQEWFSKDIEAHSQEKGELNQEQLKRLHTILKPFMLRRVKKDVENEIGPKTEVEISCKMTERQSILYNSIKRKLHNISDLFTSVDSKVKVENLMNLVMQFRKVCNHPELFERHSGKIPFLFRDLAAVRSSLYVNPNEEIPTLIPENSAFINFKLPKLIFDEAYEIDTSIRSRVLKHLNLFSNTDESCPLLTLLPFTHKIKGLLANNFDMMVAQICILHYLAASTPKSEYLLRNFESSQIQRSRSVSILISKAILKTDFISSTRWTEFMSIQSKCKDELLFSDIRKYRFYIPATIAYTPELECSSRKFTIQTKSNRNDPFFSKMLYGFNFKSTLAMRKYGNSNSRIIDEAMKSNVYENYISTGMISSLVEENKGFSQIELPLFERMIAESAKLRKLDELLAKLCKEGHRVLIFCQMTRMIDILEEYMSKRRYSYFRMDGSTNIADRRDMVNEFQSSDEIFAFLLSTRAGGLGVNLTAADTVIFYDNDWNPTMDAQATDRAHRIGQSKPVMVYRLVTNHSIEERILKRAQQKQNVQTTVYSGGAFKADIFKQSEIFELLYSEEEVKKIEEERRRIQNEYNQKLQLSKQIQEEDAQQKKKEKKQKKEEDKKNKTVGGKPIQRLKNIFAVKRNEKKLDGENRGDEDDGQVMIVDDNENIDDVMYNMKDDYEAEERNEAEMDVDDENDD